MGISFLGKWNSVRKFPQGCNMAWTKRNERDAETLEVSDGPVVWGAHLVRSARSLPVDSM